MIVLPQHPVVRSDSKNNRSRDKADVATSTFLLVVFAQAVGLTVGSEDRFRERAYMAVLAQTVRLALDFDRIVVARLATSGSLHHPTAMLTFPKCAPHERNR